MSEFKITHVRKNKTSTDPKSPYFENSPESSIVVTVRAATPEGAVKKAVTYSRERGYFGVDESEWTVLPVEDMDADPE